MLWKVGAKIGACPLQDLVRQPLVEQIPPLVSAKAPRLHRGLPAIVIGQPMSAKSVRLLAASVRHGQPDRSSDDLAFDLKFARSSGCSTSLQGRTLFGAQP